MRERAKKGAVKMLDITPIMMVSMSIATNRIETPSNGVVALGPRCAKYPGGGAYEGAL
ncbi:MAG: hypothetical protein ACXV2B_06955 [Halobacteriota archaeon]